MVNKFLSLLVVAVTLCSVIEAQNCSSTRYLACGIGPQAVVHKFDPSQPTTISSACVVLCRSKVVLRQLRSIRLIVRCHAQPSMNLLPMLNV